MDNLKSSPSLERNYKELVYSLSFYSAGVIGSAKSSPFLPWKSALFKLDAFKRGCISSWKACTTKIIDLKGLGSATPEVVLEVICELCKQSRTAVVVGNRV